MRRGGAQARVGLPASMWHRQSGTLSGGNKRKVALAFALVGDPALVLLDEPSSGACASSINGTGHRPHHAGRISSEADSAPAQARASFDCQLRAVAQVWGGTGLPPRTAALREQSHT